MILIVGTQDDATSVYVQRKIEARGEKTVMFDTTRYPLFTKFTFTTDTPAYGMFQAEPDGPRIPFSEIRSVYRRWSRGVNAPVEKDPLLNEVVYWNIESAIGTFCRCMDCLWVNSQEATETHKYKGYQLKQLIQAGIRVPKTLITNDPDELVAFYESMNKQVIYKPVRGWAHTTMLTDQDLSPERLETLNRTPVKLQEFISGTDIRVYVVKDQIFAMEIQSRTLDFREDTGAPRVPIELPDDVAADCLKLARTLDYLFTGIDMRRTPEGEYVFFEGNPTPVFLLDEQQSGYSISDRLVDLLLAGKS